MVNTVYADPFLVLLVMLVYEADKGFFGLRSACNGVAHHFGRYIADSIDD